MSVPDLHPPTEIEKPLILNALMTKDLNSRMIHLKKPNTQQFHTICTLFAFEDSWRTNTSTSQSQPCTLAAKRCFAHLRALPKPLARRHLFYLTPVAKKNLLQQDTNHQSKNIPKSNWNISCLLCGGCGRVVWCSAPAVFGIWSS